MVVNGVDPKRGSLWLVIPSVSAPNSASAWQIQKWMLTVIYKMEHRAPNGEAKESTQGSEGICNPIGGTTI